jgi:hypothetical protein
VVAGADLLREKSTADSLLMTIGLFVMRKIILLVGVG